MDVQLQQRQAVTTTRGRNSSLSEESSDEPILDELESRINTMKSPIAPTNNVSAGKRWVGQLYQQSVVEFLASPQELAELENVWIA